MFSLEDRIEAVNAREDAQYVGDTISQLQAEVARLQKAAAVDVAAIKQLIERNSRLRDLLQELDDHFDDEVDINDNGGPNDAMRWQQRIREVLGTSRF